jgi:5'-methylthioadenosine phosphorylase
MYTAKNKASIGIIGGSGFYKFFEETGSNIREIKISTPYGDPSDQITIANIAGHSVAFIQGMGETTDSCLIQ